MSARWLLLTGLLCSTSAGATLNDRLDIDLSRLRASEAAPNLLAHAIPHAVSSRSDGWEREGDSMVWRYRLTVPGASHLLVRFDQLALPTDARMRVANPSGFGYDFSADVLRPPFTTPVIPGSTLTVTIAASTRTYTSAAFRISQVYVGGEPPAGAAKVSAKHGAIRDSNAPLPEDCEAGFVPKSCRRALLQNYACHADPQTAPLQRASVGLIISDSTGARTCSGTLVNTADDRGDNLIATAAHCAGAERDFSAQSVTVYWNRVTPCGTPVTAFYNMEGPTSAGYVTVAAKLHDANPDVTLTGSVGADGWLLRTPNAIPDGANPYWAGVDARDTTDGHRAVPNKGVDPSFTSIMNVSHPDGESQAFARSAYAVLAGKAGGLGEEQDPRTA